MMMRSSKKKKKKKKAMNRLNGLYYIMKVRIFLIDLSGD